MKPPKPGLCRCSICRKWFRPDPRAAKTQKTCSGACRKKHRRRLERQRREKDLHEYRVAERRRQRESRKRRRDQAGNGVVSPDVSQAGLDSELVEVLDEILDFVDKTARLSRTALRRKLKKKLCDLSAIERRNRRNRGQTER